MRRALSLLAVAALAAVSFAVPAQADDDVPTEFGTDWDDPTTAVKPIEHPNADSCDVTLVDHEFDSSDPYESGYEPPADCQGSWSMVVLQLDGEVTGDRVDRPGTLTVGGVPILRTAVPEPSPDGITWSVEKDVSDYAALLASPQPVRMDMGDVADTRTGALDITVVLTFYRTTAHNAPISGADRVLPLTDGDDTVPASTGLIRLPRNSERLLVDVYADGSGGCEQSWYLTVPDGSGYSCTAADGPDRLLEVLVDGEVAGIAAPYPNVHTGAWSDPYLWTTLTAPRAFDLRPATVDLTPYLAGLNDGAHHRLTVRVAGAPEDADAWSTPVALRVWQDEGRDIVDGGVLSSTTHDNPSRITTGRTGSMQRAEVSTSDSHTATGWLSTSHGEVMTTVERTVSAQIRHYWGAEENPDGLNAVWNDSQTVTVLSGDSTVRTVDTDLEYRIDGDIDIDDADRLTTVLRMSDTADLAITGHGDAVTRQYGMSDQYIGRASWDIDAPRADRHAVGSSQQHYRLSGDRPCYDHTLAARNGRLTVDRYGCGPKT